MQLRDALELKGRPEVGNVMNIEGGVGGDFLRGGLSTGLMYYASVKLTNDEIEGSRILV